MMKTHKATLPICVADQRSHNRDFVDFWCLTLQMCQEQQSITSNFTERLPVSQIPNIFSFFFPKLT